MSEFLGQELRAKDAMTTQELEDLQRKFAAGAELTPHENGIVGAFPEWFSTPEQSEGEA